MIGYIHGKVIFIDGLDAREIIVEAGNSGIGYRILMAVSNTAGLQIGQEITLHVYTQVREDAIELYGFNSRDERTLFTRLVTVSGVGAKSALAILSTLTPQQLQTAILSNDTATLKRVPGIGPKVAGRLVLELESFFKSAHFADGTPYGMTSHTAPSGHADTRSALANLGFGDAEIEKLLSRLEDSGESLDVQGEIKWCLKHR